MFMPNDASDFNTLTTLQEKYVFRNDPRDIGKFLKEHPSLPPVLVEAHRNIMKYFPNSPKVFLSLGIAPEDMSVDHLIASIASGLDVDTSMDTLEAFDEGWWQTWLRKTQGRLSITLE